MCRCDFVMCVDKIFECLVVVNVWLVSWFSLLLQQNSLHSTSIEITLITIYRCCWSLPMLQSTFFFPFSHCSLSLSKLILSFTTFLSLDHSSHSLLFSFFSFSVWYVLDLKLFFLFLFFFNFSRSPPPKSDQIGAVGLQGVVKKALPLAGGMGR